MKELIKYSAFLMVFFLVSACNNDDADFMVQLNEPFLAVIDEEYTCITNDGDIIIEVGGIDDNRVGGIACDRVVGAATGEAEVSIRIRINEKEYSKMFLWPGCEGTQEYDPSNPNLPSIELEDGYVVKMMKLYPISENITSDFPSSKDYQIKLIIIK